MDGIGYLYNAISGSTEWEKKMYWFLKGQGMQEYWKNMDALSYQLCSCVSEHTGCLVWLAGPCCLPSLGSPFICPLFWHCKGVCLCPLLHFILSASSVPSHAQWLSSWLCRSRAVESLELSSANPANPAFPIRSGSYWHIARLMPPLLPCDMH